MDTSLSDATQADLEAEHIELRNAMLSAAGTPAYSGLKERVKDVVAEMHSRKLVDERIQATQDARYSFCGQLAFLIQEARSAGVTLNEIFADTTATLLVQPKDGE